MPSSSHLRNQVTFAPIEAPVTHSIHPSALAPPEKKRKMTITQTYFLAHTARGKLSHEAARGDHDLRLLVGHANLLDSLTVELQEAEREQDAWFEKTVAESRKPSEPKRVQFKDEVAQLVQRDVEIPDAEDDEDSDADSEDSDSEEDLYNERMVPDIPAQLAQRLRTRSKSPPPLPAVDEEEEEDDEEDFYDDIDMDNSDLALQRVPSHSASPPELVHDSDDSDDDMSGPDSPPASSTAAPAPFVLPNTMKAKDFAITKPAIHSEDQPMLQAVY